MQLSHTISFDFDLSLPRHDAIDFVRDVRVSLSKATFIENLEFDLVSGEVTASLPVNAALFGQQTLLFCSQLVPTATGAALTALEVTTNQPGWAEVAGEAVVRPAVSGSHVTYTFDITIHLHLPKAEKWGTKALSRMIEFTAGKVLQNITSSFPDAVQQAAKEVEASFAS